VLSTCLLTWKYEQVELQGWFGCPLIQPEIITLPLTKLSTTQPEGTQSCCNGLWGQGKEGLWTQGSNCYLHFQVAVRRQIYNNSV
jgi:hypothetical protein